MYIITEFLHLFNNLFWYGLTAVMPDSQARPACSGSSKEYKPLNLCDKPQVNGIT